jgi:hypothetical protein
LIEPKERLAFTSYLNIFELITRQVGIGLKARKLLWHDFSLRFRDIRQGSVEGSQIGTLFLSVFLGAFGSRIDLLSARTRTSTGAPVPTQQRVALKESAAEDYELDHATKGSDAPEACTRIAK